MYRKSLRRFAFVLTLVSMLGFASLGPLALAQTSYRVTDTFTNLTVAQGSTDDLGLSPPGFITQRVFRITNTSTFTILLNDFTIQNDQVNGAFSLSSFPFCTPPCSGAQLPQGLSTSFSVQMASSTPGTYGATVRFSTNVGFFSFRVVGRILENNPAIQVLTSGGAQIARGGAFDFGSIPFGSPRDQTFRVLNNGNQTLTISSLTVSNADFAIVPPIPSSISRGTESTFVVRMLASSAGSKSATVSIVNNDPNDNPFTFTVRGTVGTQPLPNIQVTRSDGTIIPKNGSFSFGSVANGALATQTFRICNTGTATLSLSGVFVSGTGFSVTQPPSFSLAPGVCTTFTLQLQSTISGPKSGTVTISSNDPDDNPFPFSVSGTIGSAPAPDIAVSGATNFGATPVNVASDQTYQLSNTGSATLNISSVTVSGEGFSLIQAPASSVGAGGSTTFKVRLLSPTAGSKSGTIVIRSNDPDEDPFVLSISGRVDPPPAPDIAVSGTTNFGSTAVNVASDQTYQLSNTGNATLNISSVIVSGEGFSLIQAPASSVGAGGSTTFKVRLLSPTAGSKSGTITIGSNDPDENPFVLPISGQVFVPRTCQQNTTTLCFQGGRFEVKLRFTNGGVSDAQAVPFSNESGFFWFFDPGNLEAAVKVLDGRASNGRFWVFYCAITDLRYDLTVNDLQTLRSQTYTKPAGSLCGGADTNTFVDSSSALAAPAQAAQVHLGGVARPLESALLSELRSAPRSTGQRLLPNAAVRASTAALAGTCTADSTTLCLLDNRFKVTVSFSSGQGQAVPYWQGTNTGFFWFFNSQNLELTIKVLDGRPVNGRFWVFFGSLTDVPYTVTVTDTATGAVRTYNSPGSFCGLADTSAF